MSSCQTCIELEKELQILKEQLSVFTSDANEATVCIDQIKLLHNRSVANELSYEETKKFEIYVKLLIALRNKANKKENNPLKDVSNQELESLFDQLNGK